MAFACSGWGSGARQTLSRNGIQLAGFCGDGLPDTLLGFETTGPLSLRPVWETGDGLPPGGWRLDEFGVVVVASLWWWGVVFDLWIVVASIWRAEDCRPFGVGVFCVSDNAIFRFFREFFNCFVL